MWTAVAPRARPEVALETRGARQAPEDPPLGMWVQNQRSNKKKLDRGEPSLGLTAVRLTELGLV